jgi:exopolyphosphatase/guanosine-5'-triphosphate,3'-diphosphate pyrophosphatase
MQNPARQTVRAAAVDIGSNTVHLVVVDARAGDARLDVIDRWAELVRLGADVAALGAIGPERAARTEDVLRRQAERARHLGATVMLGMATEGVRAASNAGEMLARFGAALGTPVVLLTGMEEAMLTFWGGASTMPDPLAPLAVADLGGGSCEIALGQGGGVAWARSLPLGSGRLIDALQPADPPTADDRQRLYDLARSTLETVAKPDLAATALVGVGGTATAMARIAGGERTLARAQIATLAEDLGMQPAGQIAAQRGVDAGRARLLVGGTAAWLAIMDWLGVETIVTSESGVREGAIIAWLRAGDGWQALAHAAAPESQG